MLPDFTIYSPNNKQVVHTSSLNTQHLIQVRFPKSKKRRIKQKWCKQKANYKYMEKYVVLYNKVTNTLHVSTNMFNKLKTMVNTTNTDVLVSAKEKAAQEVYKAAAQLKDWELAAKEEERKARLKLKDD